MFNFEDKVVIVTGGARGIGFAIANSFAKNGATAIILDLNQDVIDDAVKKIDDAGNKAVGFVADVTNSESVKAIFKDIFKQFGKIDALINNAGITKDGLLMKMKESH